MHTLIYAFVLLFLATLLPAQELYFPPAGNAWETLDPSELDWCEEELNDLQSFLDTRDTKAFLILKDGRMVLEWYFDSFTQDSVWYWASAGKSLTATLVGIAQEEGLLNIDDPTSDYLGVGWTSLPPEQEAQITIRHQLTMTTGLNDQNVDVDCTDPECLIYLAEPGARWAYHNAPYTLLGAVIEAASGQGLNQFFVNRLGNNIGAGGLYLPLGYNRVFWSKARNMARFGLLIQADGQWNGTSVLGDQDYLTAMRTPSQELNPAYGYLWWLNGQDSYLYPRLQINFPGPLVPTAPADMYAALGKNDQKLYIVPSQGLVIVRMGNDASDGPLAISGFDVELWERISGLACTTATEDLPAENGLQVSPNPTNGRVQLEAPEQITRLSLRNLRGQYWPLPVQAHLDLSNFPPGVYFLVAHLKNGEREVKRVVVQ